MSADRSFTPEENMKPDPLNEFCENKGCRAGPGAYCNISFAEARRLTGTFHRSRIRKAKRRLKKPASKGKCGRCDSPSICEFSAYRPCE